MARKWGQEFLSSYPHLPPNRGSEPGLFSPCFPGQLGPAPRPAAERHLLLLGRNFAQWRRPTQQGEEMVGSSDCWGVPDPAGRRWHLGLCP